MIIKSMRSVVLITLFVTFFSTASLAGSWQQNQAVGGFNSVNIYTPDTNSAVGNGRSLLLVLHGCVQPISNYLTANLEDAAETHGMVIAVPDAVNKAGFSCWSYWQGAINRNSGDYANLINLANTLSSDSARSIDPDQVYITGLSSGAAFAAQAACVAPDVFAGVAPSAGPTIGTSSNGAITTCEAVSAATFKSRCDSYAGTTYQPFFATQIAAVGHGTADTTVNTCYNQQNADGYANLYGAQPLADITTIDEGIGHTAQQTLWSDSRVSMLWFDGLDHSWSGGAGASGSYVAADSINFATYLGDFFSQNNLRVNRNQGPLITNHNAVDTNGSLSIDGNAVDPEGSLTTVTINVYAIDSGTPTLVQTLNAVANSSNGSYSIQSGALSDGLYEVVAQAADDQSITGESVTKTVRVGPEPPATPPTLSNISVTLNGQCAAVTGTVIDVNQDLVSVVVAFANASITASLTGNQYQAKGCNLSGGTNTATATAIDTQGLSNSQSISFIIDAGVTGDYNLHIAQNHISWGVGYSACYLEFGTSSFTMRETPAGSGQCQWVADNASACAGPVQGCLSNAGNSDSDGDGVDDSIDNCPNVANTDQADNDNDSHGNVCDSTPNGEPTSCNETRSSNYAHVSAGRATTSGFNTYAVGSGDYLGLYNIFTFKTLVETSLGYFELGNCP